MNRNSIIPMYQQLADTIREQILSGKLKESDRLMTETELESYYHVSRITVRKAISLLMEEGYITKKQGIGTFVTAKKLSRVISNKVLSFTEACEAEGKKASSEILFTGWVTPNRKIQKILETEKNEKLLKVARIRKCDEVSVMLEETYLYEKFGFVAEENLNGSICAILRERGIDIAHATKTIEICYATEEEAKLLGISPKQPLLLHYDTALDPEGNKIMCSKLLINSEKYTLMITL